MKSLLKVMFYMLATLIGIFTWDKGGWLLCLAGLLVFAGVFPVSASRKAKELREGDKGKQLEGKKESVHSKLELETLTPVERMIREREKE